MSLLDGDTVLSQLNLPGTHNSCTENVDFPVVAKCQKTCVYEQLHNGIRLLDIRLRCKENRFYLVHSVAYCRERRFSHRLMFDSVLKACLSFLDNHPTETVLMSIKMDAGNNQELFAKNFVDNFVLPFEERWFSENRMPLLSECRGKLVLLRRFAATKAHPASGIGLDMSSWIDQGNRSSSSPLPCFSCDREKGLAEKIIIQDRYRHFPGEKWEKAVLPALVKAKPDKVTAFLHCINTAAGFSPRLSSAYVNRRLSRFLETHHGVYGWFLIDFPETKLNEYIIEMNFTKEKKIEKHDKENA